MKNYVMAFVLLLLVPLTLTGAMQGARPQLTTPVEPIAAIIEAFGTQNVVTLTDPHGNVQVQAFLLSLVRDSRFPEAVNDIVIETASARYQDALDRFVRGDDVETSALRRAWQEHTTPNSLGAQSRGTDPRCADRQCVPKRRQEVARHRGRSANRLGQHHFGAGWQALDGTPR